MQDITYTIVILCYNIIIVTDKYTREKIMTNKTQEAINFFYTPGSSSDPIVQQKMDNEDAIILENLKNPKKKKYIRNITAILVSFVLPILLVMGAVNLFTGSKGSISISVDTKVNVESVYKADIFATEHDLALVRSGDTGHVVSNRIDTNLDTSPTPADIVQRNVGKKLRELAGIVDTYAPKLLEDSN